jgi:hypothetical protein
MKRYCLFQIILLVLITSCNPTYAPAATPGFTDLLRSPGLCLPPCWYGVTPGKTSKDELLKLIPAFPHYQQNLTVWTNNKGITNPSSPDASTSTFSMIIGNNWAGINIDITDNIVSDIQIGSIINHSGYYNDLSLTLEDVINSFGEPSNLVMGSFCPPKGCQNLIIVYPRKGLLFVVEQHYLPLSNGSLPDLLPIQPTLPVREIIFIDPSVFNNLPSTMNFGSLYCELNSDILPWQGYTTVDFSQSYSSCH